MELAIDRGWECELQWGSYRRKADVVISVFRIPASGQPPHILIFWRQPAGIRDVCSTPSWMLPERDTQQTSFMGIWCNRQSVKALLNPHHHSTSLKLQTSSTETDQADQQCIHTEKQPRTRGGSGEVAEIHSSGGTQKKKNLIYIVGAITCYRDAFLQNRKKMGGDKYRAILRWNLLETAKEMRLGQRTTLDKYLKSVSVNQF